VNNVAPTVLAGDDLTLGQGHTLTRWGSFVDPGADTWTATVDYGDGSGPQPLHLKGNRTFHLVHHYAAPGRYRVVVVVRDSDGAAGMATFRVNVAG